MSSFKITNLVNLGRITTQDVDWYTRLSGKQIFGIQSIFLLDEWNWKYKKIVSQIIQILQKTCLFLIFHYQFLLRFFFLKHDLKIRWIIQSWNYLRSTFLEVFHSDFWWGRSCTSSLAWRLNICRTRLFRSRRNEFSVVSVHDLAATGKQERQVFEFNSDHFWNLLN
jgi:hypothetical protein